MTLDGLFLNPAAWPWLALAPAILLLLALFDWRRRRRVATLFGGRAAEITHPHGSRLDAWRRVRSVLVVGAWTLAAVAMLQPAWGEKARTIEQRGIDLVVALDLSQSMLARDENPSRLERAKRSIRELAERARGDRLALVVFAGEAKSVVPLTQDVDSLLGMVDLAEPHDLARGGTDLAAAIEVSLGALGGDSGEHGAIVLLTDGEDLEARGRRAASVAAERGIVVHCVGYGSDRGSKIPIEGTSGEEFLRDREGNEVVTALDPESLRAITEATGGSFVRAVRSANPLVDLYESRIVPMASRAFASEERREPANRFQWPLLVAVLFMLAELAIAGRSW